MQTAPLCLLLIAWVAVAGAQDGRSLTVTVAAPTLAFASAIELDPRLGIVVHVVPPPGATVSAELIESPGKTTKLDLARVDASLAMVAHLPLSGRFTSGHIHFTLKRGDIVEHQFRQFAIRPSARVRTSTIQSEDGRVTLFVQSERLDPETSVILADRGIVDPPLPAGSATVVGPFAISTTRPGANDRALGATLHVAMARAVQEKRPARVLQLDEKRRAWTALDARVDPLGALQADVATFGTFVVVQP